MLLNGLLSLVLIAIPTAVAEQPSAAGRPAPRTVEQFYFLLPDRFANGDPANDRGGYPGGRDSHGHDPADKGFYHGGDLRGVIDRLDYIQGLGTTAIWLAPVFKNRPVQGDSAGYHGYWITDFTQVDPHFGTKDDLKRLVREAHRRGMKIYLDAIVNHTADVISYAEGGSRPYADTKTSPYTDTQGRKFDDANHADGAQRFPEVDGNAGPYTPVVPSGAKVPEWLNDPSMYHNRGESTFSGESSTHGDFAGLDDLWTERPEVVRGMTKIYKDWIVETGVDGFRLDTAKHVNMEFWPQFVDGIGRGFPMFGEVFSSDPAVASAYVRQGQLPATLDFGFQAAATSFVNGGSAQALADLYAADPMYTARDVNSNGLPTFLGNHDMGRIGTFTRSLEKSRLAHELMFLTRGQPVIYAGDEQGFTGDGGDRDARQSLFASQVPSYLDDDLLGTERTHAQDNFDPGHPLYRAIAELGRLRKEHAALRDGIQVTKHVGDGVFAFSRIGPDRVEYVVAVNASTTAKAVPVSGAYHRIYGSGTLDAVPPQSAVVFRADRPLPTGGAPTIALDAQQGKVMATVGGGDPTATVRFEAQVGDGPWRVLGTATHAPYEVRHDLVGLAGRTPVRYRATVRDTEGRTATDTARIAVESPPEQAQREHVLVHYHRPDGDYANWRLYTWGDTDPSMNLPWPQGQPFAGVDAFGAFAWVRVKPGAGSVGYLIVDQNGVKDVPLDRFVNPGATFEVWHRQGVAEPVPPPTVQQPPSNVAILHYRRADGNYTGWGLHLWDGNANPVEWNNPMLPTGIDSYGAYWHVPLVPGASGVSYIVHRGDEKDLPSDQRLDFATFGREAWILSGRQAFLRPEVPQAQRDIDITKPRAHWVSRSTLLWDKAQTDGKVYELVVAPDGGLSIADGELVGNYRTIGLNASVLSEAHRQKFPHLWAYKAFEVASSDVKQALRGQLVVTERRHDGTLLSATGVQIPGVLDDVYSPATRAQLGPVFDRGRVSLSVWAPTAKSVQLELDGSLVTMRRDDNTGVWSANGPSTWEGKRYRFVVAHYQRTSIVTDPYSVALTPNSTHSVAAKLVASRPLAFSGRPQIYELSVRDFSIAQGRGTYDAFVDGAGVAHLRKLASAGVTHVHLLPVFDFATIPEVRADQAVPACDMASFPPDSPRQQECVGAVRDRDGYNWGYDPLHYTVPEGGYALDPNGTARNASFKAMVDALHANGLRVVLDVVYNHTSSPSPLDPIVPGYYHRLSLDGAIETSTCCLNTAPEHAMMGKLVVDSVVTWAHAYGIDGFRFDLMGHHPKSNMLAVRAALDKLPGGKDILLYGEGWNFGEVADNARFVQATQLSMAGTGIGTFNDRLRDAVKGGGPFDTNPRRQGFASGLFTDPNGDPVNGSAAEQLARLLHHQDQIKVGLVGNLAGYSFVDSSGRRVTGADVDYNGAPAGYTKTPSEAVTYVDAHDNEILFDALAYKLPPGTSDIDRARMQVLALATAVLSQGTGFVTGGSDIMRSKSLDKNSYDSGDWFNAIQWDCRAGNGFGRGLPPAWDNEARWPYARPLLADPALVPSCEAITLASARFQELLRVRNSSRLFSLDSLEEVQRSVSFVGNTPGVITMVLSDRQETIVVVFNATPSQITQSVPRADLRLVPSVDPAMAGASYRDGMVTVPGRTVAVFTST
ncbi:pullulanase-type alpha-1,6-glucosidase [Allorhizocola rhizosphaerae]|uniref:pullulanase-type alpha-1,6-glucosidase n=1 Tax=Allorhizocola rhizosphaerae TaxID=1872709 RepID=UPI000E3CA455|nr:pullulanase-type alpha-1,6-glucosidase [Allorhizocola rhizosphaerae]